jgi:hypothetical protein
MKRSELKPGMQVELKRGRDYATYTTDVIVIDNQVWTLQRDWETEEKIAGPTSAMKTGRRLNEGIPVAVCYPVFKKDPETGRTVWGEDGEGILLGYEWHPRFVRSQEIVLAGSKAAADAAYEAAQTRIKAREKERKDMISEYAERLGLKTYQLHFDRSGSTVSIPTSKFDELLKEAGR